MALSWKMAFLPLRRAGYGFVLEDGFLLLRRAGYGLVPAGSMFSSCGGRRIALSCLTLSSAPARFWTRMDFCDACARKPCQEDHKKGNRIWDWR